MPWYSSVHRGSGYKSQVCDRGVRGRARGRRRVRRRAPDDTVVLVRNTTEAINVLAAALPAGTRVLSTAVEHHANMLPWRRHDVRLLPFTRIAARAGRALRARAADRAAADRPARRHRRLERHRRGVAARRARRGRAPLRRRSCSSTPPSSLRTAPIDMAGDGHRLPRALRPQALRAVRRRRARRVRPRSSAASRCCTAAARSSSSRSTTSIWADAPERYEAGSPNVIGAVALGAACRRLARVGMDERRRRTSARSPRACAAGLARVPGPADRWRCGARDASTASASPTFTLDGYRHPLLAAILERRARDRRPPRLLLRAPADGAAARHSPARSSRACARSCAPAGGPRCPAPCGRASGSAPRRRTSTAWSTPWARSPHTGRAGATSTTRAHDEYRPAPDVRALPRTPRYEPAAASASARPLRS